MTTTTRTSRVIMSKCFRYAKPRLKGNSPMTSSSSLPWIGRALL